MGKRDKEYQQRVAQERIDILLSLAEEEAKRNPERSRRYVEIAWKLAQKHRVKMGKKKYRFCRRCFTWWTSDTVRVRLVSEPYPMVVYRCLSCGAEYRIPYIREKKLQRGRGKET